MDINDFTWRALLILLGLSIPSVAGAASCPQDASAGYWATVPICSPQAWDGVFVAGNGLGDQTYQVDWCGWRSNETQECQTNCRGDCGSYGTTYPYSQRPGTKPCHPESVRISHWVCNDCRTAFDQLVAQCGGTEQLAFFDNTTCSGACRGSDLGPPQDMCGD